MARSLDEIIDTASVAKAPKKKSRNVSGIFTGILLGAIITLYGCQNPVQEIPRIFENWHYQLQDTQYSKLMNLDVEAIVVDYEDSKLSRTEISNIKNQNKTIFSYLSVGAAENDRSYWQPDWRTGNPDFIDEEVPGWPGNFYVRYWDSRWQSLMFSKIEEIADLGYNGAYLDMIDSYYYYEEKGRSTAASEMIDFVQRLRDVAKAINPDFLIVPQNAPELYQYEDYRPLIDGFGKEDTWYYDNDARSSADIDYEVSFLDDAVQDGKFVLAIDYPTTQSKINNFYDKCGIHGFAATVSNRELNLDSPVK